MSGLGAFIVTYNRPEDLERSLRALLEQTRAPDHILVIDNAASRQTEKLVDSFGRSSIEYRPSPFNLGSAGGTSLGTSLLVERGFEFIYSGDDDNPPRTSDSVERILRLLEEGPSDVGGAGTVGARWSWKRGEIVRLADDELHGPLEVDFIGGDHKLVLRREAVLTTGPPRADLFFGYPDLEHCLRIRRTGLRLLVDGNLMFEYRRLSSRLGRTIRPSLVPGRSPEATWRYYYTTRNYIFMMREIFHRPDLARRRVLRHLPRLATAWVRGPRYGAALDYYQIRGIFDGYAGKLGPTVPPRTKARGAPRS